MCTTSESIMIKDEKKDIEQIIQYPGDISHLEISQKAEITPNIAKKTIFNQRKKIKTLQQAFNKYRQKVRCLKNLVEQLKKNNLISDDAAKILLVSSCILLFFV